MYHWHTRSAIGKSKSLPGDVARVTDGIAASLRQFHISASRAADEQRNDAPKTRAQRSADAAKEIVSSQPRRRGVDARSLAASPPPRLVIKKVIMDRPEGVIRNFSPRGGMSAGRGRGAFRGRGRGAPRGRGVGPARRGGRGGRGGSSRGTQSVADVKPSWNPEEQAYLDEVDQGTLTPYDVTSNREILETIAPGVPLTSTNLGIVDTIRSRMLALTKQPHDGRQTAKEYLTQYEYGNGTLFHDSDDLAKVLASGGEVPRQFETLDEAEKLEVLQKFGLGVYQPLKQPTMEDTLGNIETHTTQNETYLPRDGEMLKARVQQLLPSSTPSSAQRRTKAAA